MDKKGYLKTIEAVIALLIVLGVVLFSISLNMKHEEGTPEIIKTYRDSILERIEYDNEYRDCVLDANGGIILSSICNNSINALLDSSLPDSIEYDFSVNSVRDDIDAENVYVGSVVIANDGSNVNEFYLYLWFK